MTIEPKRLGKEELRAALAQADMLSHDDWRPDCLCKIAAHIAHQDQRIAESEALVREMNGLLSEILNLSGIPDLFSPREHNPSVRSGWELWWEDAAKAQERAQAAGILESEQ